MYRLFSVKVHVSRELQPLFAAFSRISCFLKGYSLPTGALQECPQHSEQLGHCGQHRNRWESNSSTEVKLLSRAWHSWCHAALKQDRKAIQSRVSSLKADFNLYFGRDRSDTQADFSLRPSCDALQLVFRVVLACLSEGSKSQTTRLVVKWKCTQRSSNNQNFRLAFVQFPFIFVLLPLPYFSLLPPVSSFIFV